MAEILIPVKNPPKNCHECKNGWCNLWEQNKNMTTWKHPDCPMKELPTHGRLIDADILIDKVIDDGQPRYGSMVKMIQNAPTIIEASEERE